jgi:hypothetical protein
LPESEPNFGLFPFGHRDIPRRSTVQKRIAVLLVTLSAVLVVGSIARTQSKDPWIGTWKVNLEKSTYSPGPPPTVAATVKLEPSAGGIKTTIDATNAEGQPTHTETVGGFDGKDNPVKGAQAPNTTSALKRIDDRTFEVMGKIDGKSAVTTRVAVAADGKTMTATQTGTNPQGQSVNNVIVLDKQ